MHVCPKVTAKVPHVGGPVVGGSPNVKIGGLPAARKGDKLVCVGPPDTVSEGSSSVFINGKPAARMGDGTAHGGKIVIGNSTVLIGDSGATTEKSKAAKVEVPEFDLDEVLANPELGAIRAVNIDPASMLVDDIDSLFKEGQEFINNPTLAGAASMAIIAIPGKFIEPEDILKFKDASRKVKISDSGKVIIQYGKNAGKEKNIILSKNANKTEVRNGIKLKRDRNGFPIFNSKFDTYVPDELLGNQDAGSHFKYANEKMRKLLMSSDGIDKELGLTKEQVEFFMKDPSLKSSPDGLTWHHHQDTGRMQLVETIEHEAFVPHTGGMSIWGGGYKR